MEEVWRDIPDYPGYQVSNAGRVRSFWKQRKRSGTWGGKERFITDTPYILSASDDGNGYLKVYLQNETTRTCKKVHRLVAENFIPNPEGLETVDHIRSGRLGKLDNSVNNLRWVSRRDNIQKAYADNMCDDRIQAQNKPVRMLDSMTGKYYCYESIKEAAQKTGIERSGISRSMSSSEEKPYYIHGRYKFYELTPYEAAVIICAKQDWDVVEMLGEKPFDWFDEACYEHY